MENNTKKLNHVLVRAKIPGIRIIMRESDRDVESERCSEREGGKEESVRENEDRRRVRG